MQVDMANGSESARLQSCIGQKAAEVGIHYEPKPGNATSDI